MAILVLGIVTRAHGGEVAIERICDGKLVERNGQNNSMALMQQLSVMPPQ